MAQANVEVTITPRMMAEAFWNMDAIEQADFFAQLKLVIGKETSAGEMQWCYLSKELDKNLFAKEQACAMMAWFFNHTTSFLSKGF